VRAASIGKQMRFAALTGIALAVLALVWTMQLVAPRAPTTAFAGQALSLAGYEQASPPPAASSDGLDDKEIDAFLSPLVTEQLERGQIPGAQVAVVSEGKLQFARGYGFADLERATPATADQIFRAGSVSKLFTWTAVMQLVEEGKLDLEMDVNAYLTNFKIPSTYPQPITLAHLLTHTAGFEERNSNGAIYAATATDLLPLGGALARAIPTRIFPPGSRVAYSNYGAALAGHVVEHVAGQPFEVYVAEHILRPLDMRRTTFSQPLPSELASAASVGYASDADGLPSARSFEYLQLAPAGAVSTTAEDMAKFMLAHLQDGALGESRIMGEATARDMHKRHFSSDPRLPGMTWGFAEGSRNGHRLIMHRGSTDLVHANLVLLPDQGVGIYMAFNSVLGGRASKPLIDAFIDPPVRKR